MAPPRANKTLVSVHKDEKIRKTQLILLFQRLLSPGPRTNPCSETHIITVVSLADWSYSEENLKCYFVTTLEHTFVIKKIFKETKTKWIFIFNLSRSSASIKSFYHFLYSLSSTEVHLIIKVSGRAKVKAHSCISFIPPNEGDSSHCPFLTV